METVTRNANVVSKITKKCIGCKLTKPESEFPRSRYIKSGFRARCVLCTSLYLKEYRLKNNERLQKQRQQYYIRNRAKIRENQAEYKNKNKERINARGREYNKRTGHSRGLRISGMPGFPGYTGAHDRVKKHRGKAALYVCSCGAPATDWALDHSHITEHWRVDNHTEKFEGKVFSLNLVDYIPKCRGCNLREGSPNDAMWGVKLLKMGKVSRPDLADKDMPTERARHHQRRLALAAESSYNRPP